MGFLFESVGYMDTKDFWFLTDDLHAFGVVLILHHSIPGYDDNTWFIYEDSSWRMRDKNIIFVATWFFLSLLLPPVYWYFQSCNFLKKFFIHILFVCRLWIWYGEKTFFSWWIHISRETFQLKRQQWSLILPHDVCNMNQGSGQIPKILWLHLPHCKINLMWAVFHTPSFSLQIASFFLIGWSS